MRKRSSNIPAAAILGLLTACGGGTESDSSRAVEEVGNAGSARALAKYSGKTATGDITTEAQGDQAAGAATSVDDKATGGEMFRSAGASASGGNLFQLAFDVVRSQTAKAAPSTGASAPAARTNSITDFHCDGGGTMSGTVSVASSDHYSAEDYADISFDHCVVWTGATLDGRVAYSFKSATGDFPHGADFDVSIDYAADNLQLILADGVTWARINGAYTLGLASAAFGDRSVKITGDVLGLETYDSYDGALWLHRDVLLQDFSERSTWATGTDVSSVVSGKVTSYTFGVRYAVDTTSPLVRTPGDLYAHDGVVVVTGATGRKVRVTALDEINVRVEYDLDGDGAYELSKDKLWSDLPLPLRP